MKMQIIKTTEKGIQYLWGVLKKSKAVVTKVCFWRIPHHEVSKEDIRLKIGRYKVVMPGFEIPESEIPKSELTLDNQEFGALVDFIQENYEPFKDGVKKYLPLENVRPDDVQQLKEIFNRADKKELAEFISTNNILPDDLILAIRLKERVSAIEEYESMLQQDLLERDWQAWFKKNPWVLGSEFVGVIDDRTIDPDHVADYLMQAYDGFLDLIEIKRPAGSIKFWAESLDHGNFIPSQDLIKAITQATRYVFELERESNSIKFLERVGSTRVVKPRCILIFGRSVGWDEKQKDAYRLLNASYHSVLIMTYDHVLDRAKRIANAEASIPTISNPLTEDAGESRFEAVSF